LNPKKPDTGKPNSLRWLAVIAAVVLLIIAVAAIAINFYAESWLKDQIEQEANLFLEPDAELVIGSLDVGLFSRSVTIQDVTLNSKKISLDEENPSAGAVFRDSKADRFEVSGIRIWKYLKHGSFDAGRVHLSGADLHFNPAALAYFFQESESDDESGTFNLRSLSIEDTDLMLYGDEMTEPHSILKDFVVTASGLDFDSPAARFHERVGQLDMQITSLFHKTSSGHYELTGEGFQFDLSQGSLDLNQFKVKPLYSPQELPEILDHQTDHFDIESGAITLQGWDVGELVDANIFKAEKLSIDSLIVDISRDKNFPDKPRTEDPLLNTKFANFPFSVNVDTIVWNKGRISYREWEEEQEEYGRILFDDIDLLITGLQNRESDKAILVEAKSLLMAKSELNAQFEFWPDDQGRQRISGSLKEIDVKELNPVLEPLAFIRIRDGKLSSMDFDFTLDNSEAKGEIIAIYEDLSMRMLDSDLEESNRHNLVSFFANRIGLHSSNEVDDPRTGEIDFERETDRSMFNYWWKSLRSGIKDNIQRI